MSRKKQQEGSMKTLRELLAQPGNKKCLECDQRGPTYVDITIGSFVCTSCGGMLRGLNPPHRVKSISMTNFTPAEITFMENRGNEWCRAVYLAKYDEQSGAKPDSKGDQNKLKQFMELKYEQKRWYESPTHQRKLMESVAARAKKNTESSKATSRPASNTSQGKLKPVSAPSKQPSTNLLDGISFSSQPQVAASSAPPTQNQNSGTFSGFADFDRAFAELSTSQQNTSSQVDPFAAFQVSSQPIDFTNAASKPSNGLSATASTQNNSTDKYAALLDLDLAFNKPDNSLNKNEPFFSMSNNSIATSGLNQSTNAGLYSGIPTQQMSNSTFGTNPTLSGQNPPAPSSQNFGTAVNWNASFPNYPSTNQPAYPLANPPTYPATNPPTYPPTNPPTYPSTNPPTYQSTYQSKPPIASTTNPFFSSTQQQPAPPAQNWSNQFQMQQPTRPANPGGLPSTNPFNIGGPAAPVGNAFNIPQANNPVQTSNNPFLFS